MAANKYKNISPAVLELYSKGYTKNQIAEALGIETNKAAYIIYHLLKANKECPRKMSSTNLVELMPRDQVNRIISLASWGYTAYEIAEDICLPYNRVQVLIKEATQKNLIKKMV